VATGPAKDPRNDEPAIDPARAPRPDGPPVPGAQWDEVRAQWEVWDDDAHAWLAVGGSGAQVLALDEMPVLPPTDLDGTDPVDEAEDHIIDIDRLAAPPQPIPGAQWNEVAGRWERWDDAASAWVDASADASA
jgi:hypothetical protein